MNKKKIFTRVLLVLILLVIIATVIAYFHFYQVKPWVALLIACGGGILVFNLLISIFMVQKYFRRNK